MLFLHHAGKTVILVEKAKTLAEQGERVVFIVCWEDEDFSGKKEAVRAEDHFLFQDLRLRFAKFGDTVTLEFVAESQVGRRISELATEATHIFVDEFSGRAAYDSATAITLPKVRNKECRICFFERVDPD